jgi:hypothetical protein
MCRTKVISLTSVVATPPKPTKPQILKEKILKEKQDKKIRMQRLRHKKTPKTDIILRVTFLGKLFL